MPTPKIIFLFDVDNTLLDNDHVISDLSHQLDTHFSPARTRYFSLFEQQRNALGYADYLGALRKYREEYPTDLALFEMSAFLIDYPFANRLYPQSLDAIEHVKQWGTPVILSDGNVIFQPRKVQRSGIQEAVAGQVLIYIHKEQMLADVQAKYPADHYVLIDDKVRILTAVKKQWGTRLTTVFPRQGHYATDAETVASYPAPDITIERIGDLKDYDLEKLLKAAHTTP